MLQTTMTSTLGTAGEQVFTDAQLLALIGRCQKSTLVMLGTVKTRLRLGMQRLKLLLQESV